MRTPEATVDQLRERGVVYAHLASLIGPDTSVWGDADRLDTLSRLLEEIGDHRLAGRVDALSERLPFDTEQLQGQWTRWFDQGRLPPYECSNKLQGAAGHTGALADIAGFYRAFALQADGERPDHLVAELEFMAFVTLAEADALDRRADEQRDVSADAARTFLRDHLGGWLDAWSARVVATADEGPWAELSVIINDFVAAEARRRNVIPVRSAAAFADNDLLFDEEAPEPLCGEDTEEL